jgi:hypothetical protein
VVPLRSIEAHLGDRRYSYYSCITSALEGGEWSASRPGRALPPGERAPGTHCTGGWVNPRAGLDAEVRGKFSASVGDRTPAVQSVVTLYTDCATLAVLPYLVAFLMPVFTEPHINVGKSSLHLHYMFQVGRNCVDVLC